MENACSLLEEKYADGRRLLYRDQLYGGKLGQLAFPECQTACGNEAERKIGGRTLPARLFCENGAVTGRIPNSCEVPMIDWCAAYSETSGKGAAFYASDLHGCDHADGLLRITLLRSVPFADHHPFPRNERTGFQEIGTSFFEVFLSEEEGMNELNLPKRARKRLHGVEVLEVTGHPADPDAYPVEKPYPLQNELENVVTESVRKNADGQWEIHLMNYGEETSLELPSGEKLHLPARSYVLCDPSNRK